MQQVSITTSELFQLIGEQQVQIAKLQQQNRALAAALAEAAQKQTKKGRGKSRGEDAERE